MRAAWVTARDLARFIRVRSWRLLWVAAGMHLAAAIGEAIATRRIRSEA